MGLNGIGPETADAIILYCLGKPIFMIDEYTKRLFRRLGVFPPGNNYEAWQDFFMNNTDPNTIIFQQYHALIIEHCKLKCSKKPLCQGCPLNETCDFYQNNSKPTKNSFS